MEIKADAGLQPMGYKMKKLNWGIIGPGSIAKNFADALAVSEQGQLFAVASRDIGKARDFANKYAASKFYNSYQHLVDDPEVDIIYIATPQSFHYQHALLCLEAGKHVLMEKPLTINAAQTENLINLAQCKNLLLQEALWSRFTPCFAQVKRWISQGKIGQLQYICSDIGFAFADRPDHRLFKAELGGGALLDLGVYSITLSQLLIGEQPSQIQAMGKIGASNVDENTTVNMSYPSGCYAQFTCTIMAQASNSMTIMGSEGRIVLPACFWNGSKAILQRDGVVEEIDFLHKVNGFEYQIKESMACVIAGNVCSKMMPHSDSLVLMQTMDEIRRQIGLKFSGQLEAL
ncbi:MAG: putative dehydrogenase [Paraglaciecola sp.]